MKHISIFLCMLPGVFTLSAQSVSPGGVEGALNWYTSAEQVQGHFEWTSRVPDNNGWRAENGLKAPDRGGHLNFNPALYFNGADNGLVLPMPPGDLAQLHIFAVYEPADTATERTIWSVESDTASRMVLTTHRMADLEAIQYMNFDFKQQGRAEISTYYQNGAPSRKSATPPAAQKVRIAGVPAGRDLPVSPFKGIIPEIVVFNRFLTDEERLQVESYLALKYGITLRSAGPVSYLNAHGQTLWNGMENVNFHHRVTGIGRDDASGLYQQKSTASREPGLLTIGVSPAEGIEHTALKDNQFLIWGDNLAPLDWTAETPGLPQMLNRRWLMNTFGYSGEVSTALEFNTTGILTTPATGNTVWWLVIDRSGTGDFPLESLDFYPAGRETAEGVAVFDNLHWDTDGSGKDVFTLAAGPAMLPVFQVLSPFCDPAADGALALTMQGGRPPYTIRLTGAGKTLTAEIAGRQVHRFNGIQPGEYRISIEDASRRRIEETIFVQGKDAPLSGLSDNYRLPADQPLLLDAATETSSPEIRYSWAGPGGFTHSGPTARIDTPGLYELTLERNGCRSRQIISVEAGAASNLTLVDVFPNPTTNGVFHVRTSLDQPAPVEISVYNALGERVLTRRQSGDRHYLFKEKLHSKGVYLIKVQSEHSSRTIRLIVD